jgi:hypothetical protein
MWIRTLIHKISLIFLSVAIPFSLSTSSPCPPLDHPMNYFSTRTLILLLNIPALYFYSSRCSPPLFTPRLAATNATSIIGRILPLMLAQYVGPINIASSFALISAIMMFVWTKANGRAGVLAFDVIYGVSSGKLRRCCGAGPDGSRRLCCCF